LSGLKFELDALANKDFQYLTKTYLPKKLSEKDWLSKYQVRRFPVVYEIDGKKRMIRILAIGHRREVYEELVERFCHLNQRRK
jgi:mRNA-degrading endonuclease RelE of RelBE toxin-antitoxin system